MTKAEIIQQARHLLDELVTSWIANTDASYFDMNQAAYQAYCEYAKATKCFPVSYNIAAVANVHTYPYAALASVPLVIEDCEDVWLDGSGGSVTCTVDASDYKTGAGSAKNAVAAGAASGLLVTEVISSTSLANYTHIKLWIKSSIALAAGQLQFHCDDTAACASPLETIDIPALVADAWTRVYLPLAVPASDTAIISLGVKQTVDLGAFNFWLDDVNAVDLGGSAGTRMFEINHMEYNDVPLIRITRAQMDMNNTKWRTASSGTPSYWMPWGDRQFRVWRPASGTSPIYVEGFEIPASSSYDADTETPNIHVLDHPLLAIKTALIVVPRELEQQQMAKIGLWKDEWARGIQAAYKRIWGSGGESIVFNRHAMTSSTGWTAHSDTITNLT